LISPFGELPNGANDTYQAMSLGVRNGQHIHKEQVPYHTIHKITKNETSVLIGNTLLVLKRIDHSSRRNEKWEK